MSEAGPQVNGPASPTGKYIDHIDPDDPEYIKNLQRPAEVKEDLQQMENRSRVKVVLNSQAFKEELEQVVEEQLRSGPFPASLLALQQITDLLLPHAKGGLGSLARASAVIPINDLRGVESLGFAKGEKLLRCKLAALYRLVDLCGWSHGIHNHITVRVNSENEHFLLNPFGLTYSEITASSLIKVDVKGDVLDPGSTNLGPYRPGFLVHAAIHQARPDIKCIVHLHTPAAVAVSALKCGLLPMSQEALICGNISYHDFQGVTVTEEEREKLARNLGVHNKVLVLRNRGILACGETIEEAFHYVFNVMSACETQVRALPLGIDNIVIPSEEVRQQSHRAASQGGGGGETKERKWRTGELEFEALMRTLDNSGYRTGYAYRMPVVKQERHDKSNSEVEIPPASSSFTYIFDGDYLHSKYASPLQAAKDRQKNAFRAGWMTTPNAYKKTEIEEIGTVTPKKITKWVPEGDSPNRLGGTPIKIDNPNQFAPQGDNPKEFKQKQKSIKKDYYEERITAGPQSKILEGITWDEAQKAKDGQLNVSGDQLIVVGAASKGIIQRDHQHNAVVYRQYYAANPFENMSEAEIEQYQAEVQRKERGEPEIEEQIPQPSNEVASFQQPQLPEEPETQETDVVQQTRPEVDTNGFPEALELQHPPGHHTSLEDRLLFHRADKVAQTSPCDTQTAEQCNQGQQMSFEANPVLLNTNCHHSIASQITCDQNLYSCSEKEVSCNGIQSEDVHCDREEDCSDAGHSHTDNWDSDKEHRDNLKWPDSSPCWWSFEGTETAAQEVRWHESETVNSGEGFVSIQLNPIELYHGQAESGVMKVRFSIQSIVRRRVRSELSRGGSVEEIYASVSEPFIEHCQSDGDSFDYCHTDGGSCEYSQSSLGHHVYVDHVNVKKSVRKITKPAFYNSHIGPASDSELKMEATSDVFAHVDANDSHWKHSNSEANPEIQHKIDLINSTNDANLVEPELSHHAASLIGSEDFIRLDRVEDKCKQTPNTPRDAGGERQGTDMPVGETSRSKPVSHGKLATNCNTEQSSNLSYYPAASGREKEASGRVSLPLSSYVIDEEDIMFADEELDEDIVPAQTQDDRELQQPKFQTQTTFQKKDNWRRGVDRKRMPPPPLPPAHKLKNSRLAKRGIRQKIVHTRPSLSPVKEELGATVEEMEEMEAILEAADDSFEQLLASAEDDFLASPLIYQKPHNSKPDLKSPLAKIAPMALEEDLDCDDEHQPCRVTDNSLLFPRSTVIEEDRDETDPLIADSDVYKHMCQMESQHCSSETDHAESLSRGGGAEISCNDLYEDNKTEMTRDQIEDSSEDSSRLSYPDCADVSLPSLVTNLHSGLSHEASDIVSPPETQQAPDLAPETQQAPDLAPETQQAPDLAPETQQAPDLAPETQQAPDLAPETQQAPDLAPATNMNWVMESSSISLAPAEKRGTVASQIVQGADYTAQLDTKKPGSADVILQEQEVTTGVPPRKLESKVDVGSLKKTGVYIGDGESAEMHVVQQLKTRTNSDGDAPNTINNDQWMNFLRSIRSTIDTLDMNKHDGKDIVCQKTGPGIDSDNRLQTTEEISDDLQHITRETNNNDMETVTPSRNVKTYFDDIMSKQNAETAIGRIMPAKNIETDIDDIVAAKNIETDTMSTGNIESDVDGIVPLKNIETLSDDTMPARNIESDIDDIMPLWDRESDIDDIMPLEDRESDIDDIMPLEDRESDIDDIMPVNKIETVIDDTIPTEDRVSDFDDIMPLEDRESDIDDIMPLEDRESDIDDIMPLDDRESDIDDIMPLEDIESDIDDIVPVNKIETVIDDTIPTEDRVSDFDDIMPLEDRVSDFDDIMPLEDRESDIDDIMPLDDRESDIDDIVPEKNIETYIDDIMPINDIETAVDNMPARNIETVIDDIMPIGNTETDTDDMPAKNIDTDSDDIMPTKNIGTDFVSIMSVKNIDAGLDLIPRNRIETKIDDATSTRIIETRVSEARPHRKTHKTDIISSHRKTETNIDDATPTRIMKAHLSDARPRRKTHKTDVITSHRKTETNIDDATSTRLMEAHMSDARPHRKIHKTDVISSHRKTETNSDVTPTRIMETNVGDARPHRKTHKTDVINSHRKTETNIDDFMDSKECKLEKGSIIPKFTVTNHANTSISGPTKKKTDQMQQKNMLHASEGPIQTSSPKFGRAASRDSPFKPYLQKLGKSEETLLAIMPLEGHVPQISAKSQEELEDFTQEGRLKLPLSRSRSLGPHHMNRKRQKHRTAFPHDTRSKETLVDDFVDSWSPEKESFKFSKTVLDKDTLERHNAYMELQSRQQVFRPSVAVPDFDTGSALPPLPDTTEVPSVSDTEEQREVKDSKVVFKSRPAGVEYRNTVHTTASSESPAATRKWVPKQKPGRRRRQQQDEGSVRDVRCGSGRDEIVRSVDKRRSVEPGDSFDGRSQADIKRDSSESMRDVRRLVVKDKLGRRSKEKHYFDRGERQELETDHTSRYDKQRRGKHNDEKEKEELESDYTPRNDSKRKEKHNVEKEKEELESDYTPRNDSKRKEKHNVEKEKEELENDHIPKYDKQKNKQRKEKHDESYKQELESDHMPRHDKQSRRKYNDQKGQEEWESDHILKYDQQARGRSDDDREENTPDYSQEYYNDGRRESSSRGRVDEQDGDYHIPVLPDTRDKVHERAEEENKGNKETGKADAEVTSGDVKSGQRKYSRFRHKKIHVRSSSLLCLSRKTKELDKGMKEREDKKSNVTSRSSENLKEQEWKEVLSQTARDGEYLSSQASDVSGNRTEKQNKVYADAELRNNNSGGNQQGKQNFNRSRAKVSDEQEGQVMERDDERGKWRNQQHQKEEGGYRSHAFEEDRTPNQDKKRRWRKHDKRPEKHQEAAISIQASDEETPEYEDHFIGLKREEEENTSQISESVALSRNDRLQKRQGQLGWQEKENSENRKTKDKEITGSRQSHKSSDSSNRKLNEKEYSPFIVNTNSESVPEFDYAYSEDLIKKQIKENLRTTDKNRTDKQISRGFKDDTDSRRKNTGIADNNDGYSTVAKTTIGLEDSQRHGNVSKKRDGKAADDVFYDHEIQIPNLNKEGKNKSTRHTSDNSSVSDRQASDARHPVRKTRISSSDKDVTDNLKSASEYPSDEDNRYRSQGQKSKNSVRTNRKQSYRTRRSSSDMPDIHVTTTEKGDEDHKAEKLLSKSGLNTESRSRLSDEAEPRSKQSHEAEHRSRRPHEAGYSPRPPNEAEYRSRLSYEKTTNEGETPKTLARTPETQKYAGFVKRTGRSARKSHPMKVVDVSSDSREDRHQDESIDESNSGHRNDRFAAEPIRPEDEGQEFDSLLLENPIQVNVNDDDDNVENQEKRLTTKKGIFNLLSCVGGKSSDAFSLTEKHKKKQTKAYYEEGERWKVKKLSRSKEKGEKSLHYFDKSEDETDDRLEGLQNLEQPAGDNSEDVIEPPPLPAVKLSEPLRLNHGNGRHRKRPHLQFHSPETFDSTEAFRSPEEDESLDEQNNDESYRREYGRTTFGEEFGESAFTRPQQGEISAFSSFGKSNISTSKTKSVSSKYFNRRKISHLENEAIAAGENARQPEIMEVKELHEKSVTSNNMEKLSDLHHPHLPSFQGTVVDTSVDTLNDLTLASEVYTVDEYPQPGLNASAPAYFSIEQHQTDEERPRFSSIQSQEEDHSGTYYLDSFDEPRSFDVGDLQHGGHNRTDSSFDDPHPTRRRVSEASFGSESAISQPRSTSSVTNPLIYDPWRCKAKKKKRSQSVSEMVHSRGAARPARAHSIGEVYNSTVASSVARRRARTSQSGDVTSRMYQPRYFSRSHTSLADTSFSSARHVRQRSFSGFDHSVRSPEPGPTVTVRRSESERQPSKSLHIVEELERKNERSKSERHTTFREELGEDKPVSPAKSDTMKSTDSASGGETLEEHSSKEGSPTKEHPSPVKEKKKKKKFRIPSFSKKKSKESKGSAS